MCTLLDAVVWRCRAWAAVRRARRCSGIALVRKPISRVLVVCYGNIYRSAFAGAYLKMHVDPGISIRSGGFHSHTGRPATDRHIAVSGELGVDLTTHRSSLIKPADLAWADIVVIMDRKNWVRVLRMGADRHAIVWLGIFAPGVVEIADPYEMNDAAAAELVRRLLRCCQGLAATLNRLRPS